MQLVGNDLFIAFKNFIVKIYKSEKCYKLLILFLKYDKVESVGGNNYYE